MRPARRIAGAASQPGVSSQLRVRSSSYAKLILAGVATAQSWQALNAPCATLVLIHMYASLIKLRVSSIEVTKITSRFLIVEVNFEVSIMILWLDSLIRVIARMLLVIRSVVAVWSFVFPWARLTHALVGVVVSGIGFSSRWPVGHQTGVLGTRCLFNW